MLLLLAVDNAKVVSNVIRANHCIIAEDCGDSSFYSNDLYPFGWGFSEQADLLCNISQLQCSVARLQPGSAPVLVC